MREAAADSAGLSYREVRGLESHTPRHRRPTRIVQESSPVPLRALLAAVEGDRIGPVVVVTLATGMRQGAARH